ncbi:MAG: hypothetical protein CVU65_09260 [Deltaproteobacteria bacterium HGW-Deltaproteobacteria-22]|jgi:hypothetical protein|nr:MAG: hypothetical protein CVU65_09260 [Deltaproteobacteria bacterium HGW-Deltaproteobacteria-22]
MRMLFATCARVFSLQLFLLLFTMLAFSSTNCAVRPRRPSAIAPAEPDPKLDGLWKEHRDRADSDSDYYMPNQFIVFSRKPFPSSEKMKLMAEKLGVRLIQEIPDMGIWLMECDCHGKLSEVREKQNEAEKLPGVENTSLNFLMDLN